MSRLNSHSSPKWQTPRCLCIARLVGFLWGSNYASPPPMAQEPLVGQDLLINSLNAELNPICHLLALLGCATIIVVSRLRVKASRSHLDTTSTVGLLWVRDQPVPANSTWQNTTFTRDRHPRLRSDSNSQSRQAKGRTAKP